MSCQIPRDHFPPWQTRCLGAYIQIRISCTLGLHNISLLLGFHELSSQFSSVFTLCRCIGIGSIRSFYFRRRLLYNFFYSFSFPIETIRGGGKRARGRRRWRTRPRTPQNFNEACVPAAAASCTYLCRLACR